MKKIGILLLVFLLAGCAPAKKVSPTTQETTHTPVPATTLTPETTQPPESDVLTTAAETVPPDPIQELMDNMTTEELVGQLFLARYPGHAKASDDLEQYHLGAYILFSGDFEGETPSSISEKLQVLQDNSPIPLLIAVDEEGGTVARLSGKPGFRESRFPSPRNSYDTGGMELVLQTEEEKCGLLLASGVNVNMAPVCDITTDSNAFMYKRSLGQSPEVTGDYIREVVTLMNQKGVGSVLKHFPGYGNNADTHIGSAVDSRPLEELEKSDLIPFAAGIDAGCGAILVSHTVIGCLDETQPATLSPAVIGYLRCTMGFEGVIVTDDLQMDAVTEIYDPGEAAVMAVIAGNDLLCSSQYHIQYPAVLEAVESGRIPMEQLRQSVARILKWKADLQLLNL